MKQKLNLKDKIVLTFKILNNNTYKQTHIQTLLCQNVVKIFVACLKMPTNWGHLNLKMSFYNTIFRFITTSKLIISKFVNI